MMVDVELYSPQTDSEMLAEWCAAWKMRPFPPGWLPHATYIVRGVASASLYGTDSRVAYIENVLSNPDAEDALRDEAIDAIVSHISEQARARGYLYLVGSSRYAAVLERGLRHGFTVPEHHVRQLIKVLT